MLLEFGAKNFFSFKEGFEISLRLPKKSSQKFSNILAIKGANASGKTNVIKVLSFLHSFVTNSFSMLKPKEEIQVQSFFRSKKTIKLFAIFVEDNIEYKYQIDLKDNKVIKEVIYKKEQRWTKIIQRDEDKVSYASKQFEELKTINLNRTNASIISIAKQYGIDEINCIYDLFDNIATNTHSLGRRTNEEMFLDFQSISKIYYEDDAYLNFVVDFLKRADTGILDIEIYETINKKTQEKEYNPVFLYQINEEKTFLTYFEQSSGTQSLYTQLGLYISALEYGSVLALDEFDINLHPDILPMLIDLFENKEINHKNAQLICTTHNYEIMDKLGKYKTVLVNKSDNESFLYRLDEIPGDIIRNDRAISPVYNANKLGGKPRIS